MKLFLKIFFSILVLLVVGLFVFNAIYINSSIPALDQWEKITIGHIDCGFVPDGDCYNNHSKFVLSVGGTPLNDAYRLYTPVSFWGGYETTTYDGLSYRHIYTLYKHSSLIPFWTDYLIVCER